MEPETPVPLMLSKEVTIPRTLHMSSASVEQVEAAIRDTDVGVHHVPGQSKPVGRPVGRPKGSGKKKSKPNSKERFLNFWSK